MDTVTVSPKYQIVIPKRVRETLGIRPGQKLWVYELGGTLRLVFPGRCGSFGEWPRGSAGARTIVTAASASKRVVVDSSGWIEYLADGPKAADFAPFFEREERIAVPAIVVYEVYKKLLREQGATAAERFFAQALRLAAVALDAPLAVSAAHASLEYGLTMADAIVYVSARLSDAQLVTSDRHFQNLPGVTII